MKVYEFGTGHKKIFVMFQCAAEPWWVFKDSAEAMSRDYSKFWILSGCEDIPYVQTWKQMLKKRGILTLIWIAGAAIVAGIVVLLF